MERLEYDSYGGTERVHLASSTLPGPPNAPFNLSAGEVGGTQAVTAALDTKPTMPVPLREPVVLVLMGVSGCGKTTVAALLAGRLHWPFEEGDALHPPANVAKMAAGHPLDDADRAPWLEKVADWVAEQLAAGHSGIVTCSALTRAYREKIARGSTRVVFVYLAGSRETIAVRLAARHGHYMPPSLLDSQFAALQEPTSDELHLRVDVGPAPVVIAAHIEQALGLRPLGGSER
jgi:carbohydrate kinase (thermoresistant glucokinase family)